MATIRDHYSTRRPPRGKKERHKGGSWKKSETLGGPAKRRVVLRREGPAEGGPAEEGPRSTQHNTTQHNTTQHNTTQHNTTQHNTTQHNTTQHNTTQHNTTQHMQHVKQHTTRNTTDPHNAHTHKSAQVEHSPFGLCVPKLPSKKVYSSGSWKIGIEPKFEERTKDETLKKDDKATFHSSAEACLMPAPLRKSQKSENSWWTSEHRCTC